MTISQLFNVLAGLQYYLEHLHSYALYVQCERNSRVDFSHTKSFLRLVFMEMS